MHCNVPLQASITLSIKWGCYNHATTPSCPAEEDQLDEFSLSGVSHRTALIFYFEEMRSLIN